MTLSDDRSIGRGSHRALPTPVARMRHRPTSGSQPCRARSCREVDGIEAALRQVRDRTAGDSTMKQVSSPAPCIRGPADRMAAAAVRNARAQMVDIGRFGIGRAILGIEPEEEILLPPHHALRHSGGASRCRAGTGRRPLSGQGRQSRGPRWRRWLRRTQPSPGQGRSRRRPRATP